MDVICLQELWLQQDVLDIISAAQSQFPYSHRFSSNNVQQTVPAPCETVPFMAYLSCVNASCLQHFSQGLGAVIACAAVACQTQLSSLSQTCINCQILLDSTGVNSTNLDEFYLKGCLSHPTVDFTTTSGLLLLSKYLLKNKRVHTYHDSVLLAARGYLAAEIEGLGQLACTHLSTDFPAYFGPPEFSTYEQLNANETKQLLLQFPPDISPILMGDFNHGPGGGGLIAEYEANYQILIDAGFISPYVRESGKCTWCTGNVLTESDPNPNLIDHIYVRNGTTVLGVKRVFDNTKAVNVSQRRVPLSDHYGVQITLSYDSGFQLTSGTVLVSVVMIIISSMI
jgi:endonuclease/exonuclease/phosphatase family metal-dependent hydrolase